MSRLPDPARRRLWRARLERYHRSELTVVEFCRREGVSPPSFYQWKKRLGGRDSSPSESSLAGVPKFLPVRVTGGAAPAAPTLKLPGGASIELPDALQREQLTELLVAWITATERVGNGEVVR